MDHPRDKIFSKLTKPMLISLASECPTQLQLLALNLLVQYIAKRYELTPDEKSPQKAILSEPVTKSGNVQQLKDKIAIMQMEACCL